MMGLLEASPKLEVEPSVPRTLDEPFKLEHMANRGGSGASPWAAVVAFLGRGDPYWASWASRLIEIGAQLHRRRFLALQTADRETSLAIEPDDACLVAESRRLLTAASGAGAWPGALGVACRGGVGAPFGRRRRRAAAVPEPAATRARQHRLNGPRGALDAGERP